MRGLLRKNILLVLAVLPPIGRTFPRIGRLRDLFATRRLIDEKRIGEIGFPRNLLEKCIEIVCLLSALLLSPDNESKKDSDSQ
jgi:hypothetical protein